MRGHGRSDALDCPDLQRGQRAGLDRASRTAPGSWGRASAPTAPPPPPMTSTMSGGRWASGASPSTATPTGPSWPSRTPSAIPDTLDALVLGLRLSGPRRERLVSEPDLDRRPLDLGRLPALARLLGRCRQAPRDSSSTSCAAGTMGRRARSSTCCSPPATALRTAYLQHRRGGDAASSTAIRPWKRLIAEAKLGHRAPATTTRPWTRTVVSATTTRCCGTRTPPRQSAAPELERRGPHLPQRRAEAVHPARGGAVRPARSTSTASRRRARRRCTSLRSRPGISRPRRRCWSSRASSTT